MPSAGYTPELHDGPVRPARSRRQPPQGATGDRVAEARGPEGASMTFTRLTVRPEQLGGIPCIRGLRIPVATAVDMVATAVPGHTLFPARRRQRGRVLTELRQPTGPPWSEAVDTLILDLLERIGPTPAPTPRCSRRGGRRVHISPRGKTPTTEASSPIIMRRDAARSCRCRPPGRSTFGSTANRRPADGWPR
jgi:hypothetical protein